MKPRKPRTLPPFLQHWRKKLREAGAHGPAKRVVRRECGSCSACCTTKGIPTLSKPAWKPCHAICSTGGCSIYARRPAECRDYYCAWRLGFGDDAARPDRAGGLVIDLQVEDQIVFRGMANEGDAAHMAVALRACKPFPARAAWSIIEDMARAGFRYFGCVDSTTGEGAPYLLTLTPEKIRRMVSSFARTGRAPWNTNPGLLKLSQQDMASLEQSRRYREARARG